jgi:hypothetical protein
LDAPGESVILSHVCAYQLRAFVTSVVLELLDALLPHPHRQRNTSRTSISGGASPSLGAFNQ